MTTTIAALERLQAWLDADDATHFGQHEKDLQTALDHITSLTAHVEALQDKDAGGCACAHDYADDVCMTAVIARKERDAARAELAQERAETVAWLRACRGSLTERGYLAHAAHAIEAGEHLKGRDNAPPVSGLTPPNDGGV